MLLGYCYGARSITKLPRCRLLYWKAGEGAGEQHAFDALLNALASLQGVQEQRWSAQAAALRQTVQQVGCETGIAASWILFAAHVQ